MKDTRNGFRGCKTLDKVIPIYLDGKNKEGQGSESLGALKELLNCPLSFRCFKVLVWVTN